MKGDLETIIFLNIVMKSYEMQPWLPIWKSWRNLMRLTELEYICIFALIRRIIYIYFEICNNRNHCYWYVDIGNWNFVNDHHQSYQGIWSVSLQDLGEVTTVEPEICSRVYVDMEYRKKWDSYCKSEHEFFTFKKILNWIVYNFNFFF